MSDSEARRILVRNGAILSGHFVLASGRHSDLYVNKDAVFPNTRDVSRLCEMIVERWGVEAPGVIVGPVAGGVALAQWTAHHFTDRMAFPVPAIYADKKEGGDIYEFELRRGFDKIVVGRGVFIVEDVLTTGGSVNGVADAVREAGGRVVGVGALCNRGGVTMDKVDNVPIIALTKVKADSWAPADCKLCAQGIPVNTDVGKGRSFLAANAAN